MEIVVEDREVLLVVKPVSTHLVVADSATFRILQEGEVVSEIGAIWHRRTEEWYARISIAELTPGEYQVILEAPDCPDQPKGVLTVSC